MLGLGISVLDLHIGSTSTYQHNIHTAQIEWWFAYVLIYWVLFALKWSGFKPRISGFEFDRSTIELTWHCWMSMINFLSTCFTLTQMKSNCLHGFFWKMKSIVNQYFIQTNLTTLLFSGPRKLILKKFWFHAVVRCI